MLVKVLALALFVACTLSASSKTVEESEIQIRKLSLKDIRHRLGGVVSENEVFLFYVTITLNPELAAANNNNKKAPPHEEHHPVPSTQVLSDVEKGWAANIDGILRPYFKESGDIKVNIENLSYQHNVFVSIRNPAEIPKYYIKKSTRIVAGVVPIIAYEETIKEALKLFDGLEAKPELLLVEFEKN